MAETLAQVSTLLILVGPDTGLGGDGGGGAGHTAAALNGRHHGGFLATDEGAGTLFNFEMEVKA
jgi:hypothetical protein